MCASHSAPDPSFPGQTRVTVQASGTHRSETDELVLHAQACLHATDGISQQDPCLCAVRDLAQGRRNGHNKKKIE